MPSLSPPSVASPSVGVGRVAVVGAVAVATVGAVGVAAGAGPRRRRCRRHVVVAEGLVGVSSCVLLEGRVFASVLRCRGRHKGADTRVTDRAVPIMYPCAPGVHLNPQLVARAGFVFLGAQLAGAVARRLAHLFSRTTYDAPPARTVRHADLDAPATVTAALVDQAILTARRPQVQLFF